MAPWRVRDFHADDLDAAVRLWDDQSAGGEAPAFGLSDLIEAVRSISPQWWPWSARSWPGQRSRR